MIGIFEAGGSKTEFLFGDPIKPTEVESKGIHPVFMDDESIISVLKELSSISDFSMPEQIFYYGASCGSHEQSARMHVLLSEVFNQSKIVVESDLLGTARALCGHNPGFAAILGTGSNACLFDGKEIGPRMVSFGFWLGDEGSGGHIGKTVFRAWLKGELPADLAEHSAESFGGPRETALNEILSEKKPNARMAALGGFAIRKKEHPFLQKLILACLKEFFKENSFLVEKAGSRPFHFSGSVAYYLQDEIKQILSEQNLSPGIFADKTARLLFNYHTAQTDETKS